MASSQKLIRPWLGWVLSVTLVLTIVAVWWPAEQVNALVGQAQSRSGAIDLLPRGIGPNTALTAPALKWELPARLPKVDFDKAAFDPFVGVVEAPPPPPPKPAPVLVVPAPAPPPPTRQAPPQNYRYMGSLVDPSGKQWVYLARGDTSVSVSAGTQLDEGYVVEAIDSDGVRLLYPPMDARVVIPIPPPRNTSTQ